MTIIDIKDIGPVKFEKSKRARYINISVKPFTGVRVAVPQGTSLQQAKDFVHSKEGWIQRHQERIKHLEQAHHEFAGSTSAIDEAQAISRLTTRVHQTAVRYGFSYNKLSIRSQRTRWGSCSSKNNISLNIKLVLLPDELTDYVILHELVHTRVKNHTGVFWAQLERFVGDARKVNSQLRAYQGLL